jgi:hypothetical protein
VRPQQQPLNMDFSKQLEELKKDLAKIKDPTTSALISSLLVICGGLAETNKQLSDQLKQQGDLLKTLNDRLSNHRQIDDEDDRVTVVDVGNKFNMVDAAKEEMRLRSVVIVGVPESDGSASDKTRADFAAVEGIFDAVGLEATPVTMFRMGRLDQVNKVRGTQRGNSRGREGPKPRLLKVVLPAVKFQRILLSKGKQLKTMEEFKTVFIRPSLTGAQREEETKLRDEMAKREVEDPSLKGKLMIFDFAIIKRDEYQASFEARQKRNQGKD